MERKFMSAIENRRSIYAIGKEITVSKSEIQTIVEHCVKHVPSAFHSQSSRVVILYGENHDKLWDTTKNILKNIIPESSFSSTEDKINSFKNGYGTILFFEDQSIVQGLQEQFPSYKDNFPIWSFQSSGMLQFAVWTALEDAGLGVSLQHYNPLIDDQVREEWNLPKQWNLLAQMPFGAPLAPPDAKTFVPLDTRIKIFE